MKVGWLTDFFSVGKTVFSIDYTIGENIPTENDEGELSGVAAVQRFDEYGTELFSIFRLYSLNRDVEPEIYDISVLLPRSKNKVLMKKKDPASQGQRIFWPTYYQSCSGIESYNPPDYREIPPVNGLMSGADGEIVLYSKTDGTKNTQKNSH